MGRPWSFTRRIAVGFGISLGVALAIMATALLALRSVSVSSEHFTEGRVLHVVEVERLRRAFSEKVAAERGLLFLGDALLWSDAHLARRRFLGVLEELRARLETDEARRLLEEVARAELLHEAALRSLLEARVRGATAKELEPRFLREVVPAGDATYWAMERLARHTSRELNEAVREGRAADTRTFWLILVAAALGLLGVVALAWVLARALRPLHHAVEATEERFQLLSRGAKDYALYTLDSQGLVVSWNEGAERVQGWRADDILGRPGGLLYAPEVVDAGLQQHELEEAAREGSVRTEGWRVRGDGSRFWAESLLTALRDRHGRLKGYAVLTRDITERKRVEHTQHLFVEAERLFHAGGDPDLAVVELTRRMVPQLADGCMLFLLGPSGQAEPRAVVDASPEREALLWDIIQRHPVGAEHPHSVPQVVREGRSVLVAEVTQELMAQAAESAEHLALFQRLGVCSYLMVPLRAGERSLGALLLLSHHPERRFTQTDQVFMEELAGHAALALDNARLLREAQAALELIGVASHDLGNPLHNLQLQLGKLRRAPPEDPEKLSEGLGAALSQTQRLGRLLHNLLDLSRVSSGRLELELGEVDVAELVREAVERHAEQAEAVGSRLEVEVEPGVVARWDRLRLERVLTNLLSNALKYGQGQPVEVRAGRVDGGRVRLTVRDHGPGIPQGEQHHIFERFRRVSTAGEQKGFGLGLYIVRQLVEAHGGSIRVDSTPGAGSTFTVELPLVPKPREVEASSQIPDLLH